MKFIFVQADFSEPKITGKRLPGFILNNMKPVKNKFLAPPESLQMESKTHSKLTMQVLRVNFHNFPAEKTSWLIFKSLE